MVMSTTQRGEMIGGGLRAVHRCDALKAQPYSEVREYLFRSYLSSAHRASLTQLRAWMEDAGMTVRLDAAGNLVGRYEGTSDKTLIIGSHIDSVKDAGAYDGPLGVMLGIEVVAALHAEGLKLPFAIDVYAFGDEEGSRFPASMLCSRAVCGQIKDRALNVVDRDGLSLSQALRQFGLSREDFIGASRSPETLVGYLEAHIEQGPILEAEGLALGVVSAIASQRRYEVTIKGVAGHAGTNSMALRKDALAGAAEMALAIEAIAQDGPEDLVATVGRLVCLPNAPNVVPGEVVFTVDVRAGKTEPRDRAAAAILVALGQIGHRRGLGITHRLIHDLPAAPCDPGMMGLLGDSIEAAGLPARLIVSGAGHDAMAFASVTPTAMLFIRCKDGISHNPLEAVAPSDVEAAFQVMKAFVKRLGTSRHE